MKKFPMQVWSEHDRIIFIKQFVVAFIASRRATSTKGEMGVLLDIAMREAELAWATIAEQKPVV